jgi:magnesium-dependent phosphatase 1
VKRSLVDSRSISLIQEGRFRVYNMPLRLAVFDLDFTVWQPEMYELWGPPTLTNIDDVSLDSQILKEARTCEKDMILTDRGDTPITIFDGASFALSEINRLRKEGYDIVAAAASRTDQESWANVCPKYLIVHDETTLQDCFEDRVDIDCFNDKTHHLRRLHQQTGIAYKDMAFFDNEYWNISCVSKLGVRCFYTPDGMTRSIWKKALTEFGMEDC